MPSPSFRLFITRLVRLRTARPCDSCAPRHRCRKLTYTIGGTVTGLVAGQVTLNLTGGVTAGRLSGNGVYTFSTRIAHHQQLHRWRRARWDGSRTHDCVANLGGDDLTLSANGAFTFSTAQIYLSSYDATVFTAPAGQTCVVTNGAGQLGAANVVDIVVNCGNNEYALGGVVTGLTGTLRLLEIDTGEEIDLTANGVFTFPTPRVYNQFYLVDVQTNPAGQLCWVANEFGDVKGDVINLTVHCNDAPGVTISGTVTGLDNGALIELEQGQGDTTSRAGSGAFTFGRKLPVGATYKVALSEFKTPHNATCTVINGTGTVPAGGVTNIEVACVTWRTVFVKRDANGVDSGGALGGTAGADARCGAGFKAWISDSQSSPATRFTHFAGAYRLPSGAKVADNWADLTDGSLDHAIDEEEDGWLVPAVGVYTATSANGTFSGEANCSNWTSTGADTTRVGESSAVSSAWTASSQVKTCTNNETTFAQRSLVYCFEQ